MNEQLQDYIKKSKEAGFNDDQIRQELLKAGWQEKDINKNFRKKSNLFSIIIIVLIVVAIGGGAFAAYNYLIKAQPRQNINTEINQNNQSTGNSNQQPIAEIKDCNSIDSTRIFVSPNQMTQQEKDSLKCINDALINCELAKIEFTGNGGGSYEIKGKEGQNCSIVQNVLQPAGYRTCKIPMSFISDSKIVANKQNKSDMLFVGTIPFVFTLEKTTNVQTGEIINFECQ